MKFEPNQFDPLGNKEGQLNVEVRVNKTTGQYGAYDKKFVAQVGISIESPELRTEHEAAEWVSRLISRLNEPKNE